MENKKENAIRLWDGPEVLRNRASALITMAAKSSVHQSLDQVCNCAVATKEQAAIWKDLRPKVAHGKIVDYSDAALWEKHSTLITMYHRLVLRLINYQGPMTDFATEQTPTINFDWTESKEELWGHISTINNCIDGGTAITQTAVP